LENILTVMTDRLHKSGFNTHAKLIKYMLHTVARGEVTEPLYTEEEAPIGSLNNAEYLNEYIINLLLGGFATLTRNKVSPIVAGLFDLDKNETAYKTHLRDFLIDLKEFSEENNADLYAEETAQQVNEQQQLQMQNRASVPGLLNPYEVEDSNNYEGNPSEVSMGNLQLDGNLNQNEGNLNNAGGVINSGQGY
jgi:exportin-1